MMAWWPKLTDPERGGRYPLDYGTNQYLFLPIKKLSSTSRPRKTSTTSQRLLARDSMATKASALKAAFRAADASVSVFGAGVRLSAIRCSNAVADAARRWEWQSDALTARRWGAHAAHALLYSSFLAGEERVIVECGGVYVEAIAVGELRGFVGLDAAASAGTPGVLRVEKIIYNSAAPHVSAVPSSGDVDADWERFYATSEQVATFGCVEVGDAVGALAPPIDSGELAPFVGGLIVQALPGMAGEVHDGGADSVARVRELWTSGALDPLASMAGELGGPEAFLRRVADAAAIELPAVEAEAEAASSGGGGGALARRPLGFFCRCTKAGFAQKLGTLPNAELNELREEGGCELRCQFCNGAHAITVDDLTGLLGERESEREGA